MKVLIISPCILPVPAVKGGAVLTLIESLVKENERFKRLEITVVGSYEAEAVKQAKKYTETEFIFLKSNRFVGIIDKAVFYLLNMLTSHKESRPHQYAWKYFVLSKLKKILTVNDYDRVVFQNSGYLLKVLKDGKIIKKYDGKLYYHLHNDIPDNIYVNGVAQCKILSISNYLRKKATVICGSLDGKFFRLQNGIDCNRFTQKLSANEKKSMLEKLKIPEGIKIAIFAGRIDPDKGIEQLLQAMKKLERDNLILLVTGSHNFGSTQTSDFEKRMKRLFLSMEKQVRFTGFIPNEEIWKYYKMADLAVLPSMWEEPAGLTMIEAAAAGLPVITTRSGGIPEYMSSDFSILLDRSNIVDDLQSAICEILDHEDLWREKGRLASEYVCKHFSLETFYLEFDKLIQ